MRKCIFKDLDCRVAFGGASISGEGKGYGFGKINEQEAIDLLNLAYDQGIELFDTAPIYGFGLSEKRMGKAFKNKREKVKIVSKSGVSWHDNNRVNMTNDPETTQKMLEQSLRDLQSDYIDLYMIHWPDEKIDIRRPMEVLSKAKDEGKILSIGLCNTYPEDFMRAQEVDQVEVIQSELNPFSQYTLEALLPLCEKEELTFMGWGTLDKGILTKRVDEKRSYDSEDCRSWAPWWDKEEVKKKVLALGEVFKYLDKNEVTGLEFALGFSQLRSKDGFSLVGAKSIDQLSSLMKAYKNLPEDKTIEQAVEILYKNYEK